MLGIRCDFVSVPSRDWPHLLNSCAIERDSLVFCHESTLSHEHPVEASGEELASGSEQPIGKVFQAEEPAPANTQRPTGPFKQEHTEATLER